MAKRNKRNDEQPTEPSEKTTPGAGGNTVYGLDKARIGKLLKELRTKRGMKQHELAQKLGVSQAFIFMYEAGKSAIGWRLLDKIGEALNVPATWILFLSSPDDAPNITPEVRAEIKRTKELLFREITPKYSLENVLGQADTSGSADKPPRRQ